tara:strand:+ start:1960 stop:2874 length:915 start_codon:yes stop_codon:yes gene_type:complete
VNSDRVKEPHAFLIGAPKAGTTWLANTLSQNPSICLSDPKEPNIISSHKGTFSRSMTNPDWSEYFGLFKDEGIRLDGSIHAFSCPVSPIRIYEKFEKPKFILSLRQPVERTFSHWRMIIDTEEDKNWGEDWGDFKTAWDDSRLKEDSLYGKSLSRWLEYFDLSDFIIIDSNRLRESPEEALREIGTFLELPLFDYNINPKAHSNSANRRRKMTILGALFKSIFSTIPRFLKAPVVKYLQSKDYNVYSMPLLSRRPESNKALSLGPSHYSTCQEEVCEDLAKLQKLTAFDTTEWIDAINRLSEIK